MSLRLLHGRGGGKQNYSSVITEDSTETYLVPVLCLVTSQSVMSSPRTQKGSR